MIIWIASYPKSGNTWIRALISSFLFSKDGIFHFTHLDNIDQFSSKYYENDVNKKMNYQARISKNWILAQSDINKDKKLHFFKTHNAMCAINGNNFTNKENTLAAIYIVRDPRNIILSISNHYDISIDEAYQFITNKRKIIFHKNISKKPIADPEDFNFIGDWSFHYNSWKNINFCPIKIISYEYLLNNPKDVFIDLLNFLSSFTKIELNKKRIDNVLKSTSFNSLKNLEKEQGFSESVISQTTKKKIRFFNMGKENNWKKLLNKKIAHRIESAFEKEMLELKYL